MHRSDTVRRPILFGCAATILLSFAAACDFDAVGPEQTLWQGNLTPGPEFPEVQGSVAAISHERGRMTEVGIGVEGAPAGATLVWKLREGSCEQPGAIVGNEGSYPALTVGDTNSAATEEPVILHQVVLDTRRDYIASVRQAGGDQLRIACGALTPR